MKKFLVLLLIGAFALPLLAIEAVPASGRDQALTELRNGNTRFATGHPHIWNVTAEKREQLSKGQHPLACVITCSDSRVSPEYLFDQSLGDVFVVRLAGNVVSPEAVGSVEYAVEHLHVPLVIVLGHSNCGAVGAALSDKAAEGSISNLVSYIKPAVDAAKQKGFAGDELPGAVVAEHARHGTEVLLHNSRIIDDAVKSGSVSVLSAAYDLKSGKVAWQTLISVPTLEAPVAAAPAAAPAKTAAVASVPVKAPVASAAPAPEKIVPIASVEAPAVPVAEKAAPVVAAEQPAAPAPEKEKVVTSETTKTITPVENSGEPKPTEKASAEPKPTPKKAAKETSAYAKRH
jgi:carbonic anhydrase